MKRKKIGELIEKQFFFRKCKDKFGKKLCWTLNNSVKNLDLFKRSNKLNLFKEDSLKDKKLILRRKNLLGILEN